MKLITVCSDSHEELLRFHFLPSIPHTLIPVVEKTEQHGSGIHMATGFVEAMRQKMSIVLHYTKTEKQAFIYSDVDVRFNPSLDPVPILSKILGENGYDMVCQSDYGGVCCGFMVISPSEKNAKFLQEVLDHMDKNPSLCDQRSFYEVYQSKKSEDISRPSIKLLDVHDGFGNFCHLQPGVLWQPDSDVLERRRDIVGKQFLWHANHTVGVENKMRILDRFKSICSTE